MKNIHFLNLEVKNQPILTLRDVELLAQAHHAQLIRDANEAVYFHPKTAKLDEATQRAIAHEIAEQLYNHDLSNLWANLALLGITQ